MLARRLDDAGRGRDAASASQYSERPPRDEYVLTERGRDFRAVLLALLAFGNRHFAPEGASAMVVDAVTGAPADPVLVDRRTGRPVVRARLQGRPRPRGRRVDAPPPHPQPLARTGKDAP